MAAVAGTFLALYSPSRPSLLTLPPFQGISAGIDIADKSTQFANNLLDTVDKGSKVALSVTKNEISLKHIIEDEATAEENVRAIKEWTVSHTMDHLRTKFENDFNIIVCNDYDRDKKTFTDETQALKLLTVAFGGATNQVSHYRIYLFRGGKYERGAANIGEPGHRWEGDGIQYYGVGGKEVQKDDPPCWLVLQFPDATSEKWSREQVDEAAADLGLSADLEPSSNAPHDEEAAEAVGQPDTYASAPQGQEAPAPDQEEHEDAQQQVDQDAPEQAEQSQEEQGQEEQGQEEQGQEEQGQEEQGQEE
jgi:hypothetical protein